MKKTIIAIAILALMVGCANKDAEKQNITGDIRQEESENYIEIETAFQNLIEDATITSFERGGTVNVVIQSSLSVDFCPDNWDSVLEKLEEALSNADEAAKQSGLSGATFKLVGTDENNIVTGFNRKIQYDAYKAKEDPAPSQNDVTISQAEFDAITEGMAISDVESIIGGEGTLVSEYGDSNGVVPLTRTYMWNGKNPGSNAVITFEDYRVVVKTAVLLE